MPSDLQAVVFWLAQDDRDLLGIDSVLDLRAHPFGQRVDLDPGLAGNEEQLLLLGVNWLKQELFNE